MFCNTSLKVCVGGTFDILHIGHKLLLDKAFEIGDTVYIGLTSDDMVKHKDCAQLFNKRKRTLERYLSKYTKNYEIIEIYDKYGTAISDNYDIIVVSDETESVAKEINNIRTKNRLKLLEIVNVGTLCGKDLIPVKTSRIRSGEIDKYGNRLKELHICIGSINPSKITGVKNVFKKVIKSRIRFQMIDTESQVSKQPFEIDTVRGAINRALSAVKYADLGVGIEAGLFWNDIVDKYFGVQYCAIADKTGYITVGCGPGFTYPKKVTDYVRKGKTIAECMELMYKYKYKTHNVGREIGSIGYLSRRLISRTKLTEQCIMMAIIPRLSA